MDLETSGINNFLVIHSGAGHQRVQNRIKTQKLIRRALKPLNILDSSAILEVSPLTNTGIGSSLNMNGEVACDASYIVIENGKCIDMGAMYNIEHQTPISEVINCFNDLKLKYSKNQLGQMGLSLPVILDYKYNCSSAGSETMKKNLITSKHKEFYEKHKNAINDCNKWQEISDTIGLIHINDNKTELASSSGGNFFKLPGRIGCAATYGAALGFSKRGDYEISCMCSGNGEDIIKMNLARTVAQLIEIENQDYSRSELLVQLIEREAQKIQLTAMNGLGNQILYVGVICIYHHIITNTKYLIYCHTTETFVFGYRDGIKGESEIVSSVLKTPGEFARGEFKI